MPEKTGQISGETKSFSIEESGERRRLNRFDRLKSRVQEYAKIVLITLATLGPVAARGAEGVSSPEGDKQAEKDRGRELNEFEQMLVDDMKKSGVAVLAQWLKERNVRLPEELNETVNGMMQDIARFVVKQGGTTENYRSLLLRVFDENLSKVVEGGKAGSMEQEAKAELSPEELKDQYHEKIKNYQQEAEQMRMLEVFMDDKAKLFFSELDKLYAYCQENNMTDQYKGMAKVLWGEYFGDDEKYLLAEEEGQKMINGNRQDRKLSPEQKRTLEAEEKTKDHNYYTGRQWIEYHKGTVKEKRQALEEIARLDLIYRLSKNDMLNAKKYSADITLSYIGATFVYHLEANLHEENKSVLVKISVQGGESTEFTMSVDDLK